MRFLLAALSLFLYGIITAQPRFTDSTFGNNGKVVQNTSQPARHSIDVLLQPDGKSVTLAEADYNTKTRIVLIRYNTDGSLDNTFSGDGIADSLLNANTPYHPATLKMQADGKLLVCGYVDSSPDRGYIIRYNTDGSFDASFATNGILYLPPFTVGGLSTATTSIKDLVVLTNNQLMLMTNNDQGNNDLSLIRLNSNGTIDNSFGTNGTVWLDACPSSYNVDYSRMVLQTDGKLIVGGNLSGSTADMILVRINVGGTLDNTYGSGGRLLLVAGPAYSHTFCDITLQSDNKVVVSGTGYNSYLGYDYAFVLRVGTGGALDAGFGSSGKQYISYSNSGFASTNAQISLQTDGKILLPGTMNATATLPTTAIVRLTATGAMDASFDGDGMTTLSINQHASYGIAAAQQADGNIVISGHVNNNDATTVGIARVTATGQIDNTVATIAGMAYIGTGYHYEQGFNIHVQPADQKIIDIKHRLNGISYELHISRYLPNGTPDATYGTNGHTILEQPTGNALPYVNVYRSKLLSSGKLLLLSYFTDYMNKGRIEIVRLNTNGIIDSSLGTNGRLIIAAGNNAALVSRLVDAAFLPNDKAALLTDQFSPSSYTDSVFLVQLNANGSLDAGFGTNGRQYLGSMQIQGIYKAIAAQSSGKIILSEGRYSGNGYVVSRYNTNGSADNTFGTSGIAVVPFVTQSMAVHPDDRIVLTSESSGVYRLKANGRADSSFGTIGLVNNTDYPSGNIPYTSLLAADSGAVFVIGGPDGTENYDTARAQIAKLKTNGRPDSTFGIAGKLKIAGINAVGSNSKVAALQADGKLVITGTYVPFPVTTTYSYAVLTRLKSGLTNTTGRLYTFTGNGLWSNPANWADGTVPPATITAGNSLVIDPPASGECVIDITVHVQTGATVTVKAGKKVRLPGNLIIQ